MFKRLLVLGTLSLALIGCSTQEKTENEQNYISSGKFSPDIFASYMYNTLSEGIKGNGVAVERNSYNVLLTIGDESFFETDSYSIKEEMKRKLVKIAETANASNSSKIRIIVHSDNEGNYFKNIDKTAEKAYVIKDFLVKNGYEEKRISFFGVASNQPLYDNETEDGRFKNRRIEIDIETINPNL